MDLFRDGTGFGIIHRVAAPDGADPISDPGYRTALVNRHLRAMLCREADGLYHSPDHLNAFEVAQATVRCTFPRAGQAVIRAASRTEVFLSQELQSFTLRKLTTADWTALRDAIVRSEVPLQELTLSEREYLDRHGSDNRLAVDITIYHNEWLLRTNSRRVPPLSVVRFRGEGDLVQLDSHLCLHVPAAIEQSLLDEGAWRYAFVPDLSGRYAAHVYDPDRVEMTEAIIAAAGFELVH
jgi:hypothetical protein